MKDLKIITTNALNKSDFNVENGIVSINATNVQGTGSGTDNVTFNDTQFNVTISGNKKEVSIKDDIDIFNRPKVVYNTSSFEAYEVRKINGEVTREQADDYLFDIHNPIPEGTHQIIIEGKDKEFNHIYDENYFNVTGNPDALTITASDKLKDYYMLGEGLEKFTLEEETNAHITGLRLKKDYQYTFNNTEFNVSKAEDGSKLVSLKGKNGDNSKLNFFNEHFHLAKQHDGSDTVMLSAKKNYTFVPEDFDTHYIPNEGTTYVTLKRSSYFNDSGEGLSNVTGVINQVQKGNNKTFWNTTTVIANKITLDDDAFVGQTPTVHNSNDSPYGNHNDIAEGGLDLRFTPIILPGMHQKLSLSFFDKELFCFKRDNTDLTSPIIKEDVHNQIERVNFYEFNDLVSKVYSNTATAEEYIKYKKIMHGYRITMRDDITIVSKRDLVPIHDTNGDLLYYGIKPNYNNLKRKQRRDKSTADIPVDSDDIGIPWYEEDDY